MNDKKNGKYCEIKHSNSIDDIWMSLNYIRVHYSCNDGVILSSHDWNGFDVSYNLLNGYAEVSSGSIQHFIEFAEESWENEKWRELNWADAEVRIYTE